MSIHRVLSAERLAAETSPRSRQFHGMIRRMAVRETARALWTLLGHEQVKEKPIVEVFSGIGIYARPAGDAEVIVVNVSGARHPVVIATRDEDARRAMAADLKAGDTCVFNGVARVIIRADGTIEITGGKILMGEGIFVEAGPTSEGVVTGKGTDPYSGLTYAALGNASSKVFAK
jgi:hypothetical protein